MIMPRLVLALVIGWATIVSGLMQFINPPPFGTTGDFSSSETYNIGSTVNVAWTPADSGKAASLVLYQLDSDGVWFGDMEYLTRRLFSFIQLFRLADMRAEGAVGVTRYTWLVGTRKNLTKSSLFYMSIFQEGKGPSDGNSHYFNIAEKVVEQKSTASPSPTSSASSDRSTAVSTTSSVSSSFSSSAPPRLSTSPEAGGLSGTPGATPQSSAPSNEFPLAAKIGIGAGIPAALAIGLGFGFLLFRRRKKEATSRIAPVDAGSHYPSDQNYAPYQTKGHFYGSNLNEAPVRSPVEMAPPRGESYYMPQHNHMPKKTPEDVPVRYEM
jgi:hypothetical protein